MSYKTLVFSSFFLFSIQCIQAQKTPFTRVPLKEVLFALEQQFDVKFTFAEVDVHDKKVTVSLSDYDLTTVLKQLNSQTNLQFKTITDRYISILNSIEKGTVCGFITAKNSTMPLSGATIATSLKTKGTVTDENGYFFLNNIPKNDILTVTFIGYQSIVIAAVELQKKSCPTLALLTELTNLGEVIIQNTLITVIQKQADGSDLIQPDVLGILPGLTEPDVLQSLQLLPGIQSPNETASGLHVRGGTPDQNLILFDGIRMYNSAHFFGMVSAINPYVTKKIKVFRNGASAKYGNHTAGVIDMSSDTEVPEKMSAGLGANLTHADAFVKIPMSNKVALIVSGRRSFADLFTTITFNQLTDKTFQNTGISGENLEETTTSVLQNFNEFFYTDMNAKLLVEPNESDRFSISYLHNRNKLGYDIEESPVDNLEYFLQFFNDGISGNWRHHWKENLSQETQAYYSEFDLKYRFTENQNNSEIQTIQKFNNIKEFQLQSAFNLIINANTHYNFGYELTRNAIDFNLKGVAVDDTFDFGESNKNTTHALFGEYVYGNGAKTSLNLGLRMNYFSLFESVFLSPRIYFQTQIMSNLWWKAAGEIKQQNVSQFIELATNDFGLENQVWALANTVDIPVLKSNQFSLGFLYKKKGWTVDIDAYRKEINGLTSLSREVLVQGADDFSKGGSTSYGLDILFKKGWKKYSAWASYSLGKTTFKFDGLNNGQVFDGNYDIRHQVQLTNNVLLGKFKLYLGWNIRTGIPYTNAIDINRQEDIIRYEPINAERLPIYHRLDFSTTYKFEIAKKTGLNGIIGFSLLNVYNRKNTLRRTSRIKYSEDNTTSILKTSTASLGITPNIVFRIQF